MADRGVIQQIFVQKDYDVSAWHQGAALGAYYARETAAGREPLVLDAGANIGASVVYFAASYPDALVYAIEPDPENAALLRMNCAECNVEFFEGAISSEAGAARLASSPRGEWAYRVSESGEREVRVFSAAKLVADALSKGSVPFICKIDIEGGEGALFEKNVQWIELFPLVVIELHDWLYPFEGTSRNFMKTIARYDFDVVYRGENLFCFNRRLLGSKDLSRPQT